MMAFGPFTSQDFGIFNMLYFVLFFAMFFIFPLLFPKLMLISSLNKIRASLVKIERYAIESENIFLSKVGRKKGVRERLNLMKGLFVVPPTDLDPYGIVKKFERVIDSMENKINNFISKIAPEKSEDEKSNLAMTFKGVHMNYVMYLITRHLEKIVEKTKNFQLGATVQMFLPMYEEIAKSSRDATEAFANQIPIGDSVGPLVAANFAEGKCKEIGKDVLMCKRKFKGKDLYILSAKGPGARLGKWGEALKYLTENYKIDKIITIDAAMKFEGEQSGKLAEGVGVLMGGPGTDKFRIEEVATEKNIELDGIAIKMSMPESSRPMSKKVFEASKKVTKILEEKIEEDKAKSIALIGVGNSVGISMNKKEIENIPKRLKKYWKVKEEETSYSGLVKFFPFGGG